jgi:hypothetical protein
MTQREQLKLTKVAMTQNGVYFTGNKQRFMRAVDRPLTPYAVRNPLTSRAWNETYDDLNNPAKEYGGMALPGRGAAYINPGVRDVASRSKSPIFGRSVIAHEAFHAKNPFLGKFEPLAYTYGGWKAPRPGATTLERAASGMGGLYQYFANSLAPKGTNMIGKSVAGGVSKMLAPISKRIL